MQKGATFSTLSAISYAAAVVFVRYAYRAGITPGTAIFLRFAIASAVLLLFLMLSGRWTRLPRSQATVLFLLGFLAYTTLGTTWFLALSTTPAWLVSLFVAFYPLLLSLSSWLFLGEALDRQKALALALVLSGGVALFWRPFEQTALTGILLMLLNIVVQTAYVLIGQRWTRGVPPAVSTAWMTIGAMGGTFLYALFAGQLSLHFAAIGWAWATLFGVISTALAIMFLWWGINLLGPTRAAIIGSLEPLFSVLLSVVVLGETMTALQVVGGVLVIAGALLVRIRAKRPA